MNRLFYTLLTILCFNLQATDLTDKLTSCLEDNRSQVNHENEIKALKAVSSCLSGFVEILEKETEAKMKIVSPIIGAPGLLRPQALSYKSYSGFDYLFSGIRTQMSFNESNWDYYNFVTNFNLIGLGTEGNLPNANTNYGLSSLQSNSTGQANVAVGFAAMLGNDSGNSNIGIGPYALAANVEGDYNLAIGFEALKLNKADDNFAVGYKALQNNTTGTLNQAVGIRSLQKNTTGDYNLGSGIWSLKENTTGEANTAVGHWSLEANTTGNYNTAIGTESLEKNTLGDHNNAIGMRALYFNTTGYSNSASGLQALYSNTTGSMNTGFGVESGYSNITGSSNVFLGYRAGYDETGSHKLYIANSSSQNIITGDFLTGYLSLGRAGLANGGIGIYGDLGAQFMDDDASHYVAFVAPTSVSSNVTWTLPGSDGINGQVLSTNGTGTLAWSTVSSGTGTTNSSLSLDKGTLTLTDSSGGQVSVDISGIDADTNDYVISTSLSDNVLKLTMNSGTELSQDLSSLTTNLSADTNTYLKTAALDGSNLVITMSDSTTKTIDLAGISENNTVDIATNTASISTNTTSISNNITTIAALGSDLNDFKSSTNSQMTYMRSEYSSGIASAIAMGQISIAEDGFSVGVGHGRFNGQGEQVFGVGFGGKFDNGTRFKIQASKNSMASGVGFTLSY